jgi:ABC-type transport system involved in multi-copper enzyme maturation permease subunit
MTSNKIRIKFLPDTRLGWWAFWLGLTFLILMTINSVVFMRLPEETSWRVNLLPFYGIFTFLCGLAAGILALIAVIWKRERAVLVWMTMLPGLFVIVFLLGEFLVPH